MKTLITLLLLTLSSVASANDYSDPNSSAKWRDSFAGHSFSDENYRARYSPEQRRNQRNAEIYHQNQMPTTQEYVDREIASRRQIYQLRSQPFTAETPYIPTRGQQGYGYTYGYPINQNRSYGGYGYDNNGGMRFSPAQTQGFIDQQRIDDARQRQFEAQQAQDAYNREREYQNDRVNTERFISYPPR